MASYTVFSDGRMLRGTPQEVLEAVRAINAADNEEIQAMTLDQYAAAIIEDAPYFLEAHLLNALEKVDYDTASERALVYLAQMPTSDVRIVGVNGHASVAG